MATFCLIHGQWHGGSCWQPVVDRLRARGHEAIAPDMPFEDARAGYEQRARPAIEALEGVEGPAPEWERFVARDMLGVEPTEIAGGHFPMAEDPDALAGVLDGLSGPARGTRAAGP